MKATWYDDRQPEQPNISALGWARVAFRATPVAIVTFGCLALLLVVRLVERPIFGQRRPVTPFITQFVCRAALLFLGIKLRAFGSPMRRRGVQVANHSSWLDIFALNALDRFYFVSKAEVARWPGIGLLARATGTVFIDRRASDAQRHSETLESRLRAEHKLLFFPEGTSTDGRRVLDFKSTLYSALFNRDPLQELWVQPISVVYVPPSDADPRFYGFWGDMDFGPHFIKVAATRRQGSITVTYHDPLPVSEFPDRKSLARHSGQIVRQAFEAALAKSAS